MRKIIQVVSFLGLALILGGASANAQGSTTNVDANIPFDFVVGNKSLSAGSYVLRISTSLSGAQLLEVRNDKNDTVYTGLLSLKGDRNRSASELKFDRVAGRAVLSRIITADAGYSVATGENARLIASKRKNRDTDRNETGAD